MADERPRHEQRIERILQAAQQLRAKIDANPENPKNAAYEARMEEYQTSLAHLSAGHPESGPAKPRPATRIEVPEGVFKKKG